MGDTLELRRRLDESIEEDIGQRTAVHKARMTDVKLARAQLKALGAVPEAPPLALLALGDSWFDYPLSGDWPSPAGTDVIAQLRRLGSINPYILNISHYGDATTDLLGLKKQKRLLAALAEPDNWLSDGRPDAILVSGGGNDIAGDRFCIYLDYRTPGASGLNDRRFEGVMASIEASYLALFALRDQYAPGTPILGHAYDFPVPNGARPPCAGPWLKPSLTHRGWFDVGEGARIVRNALVRFRELLISLAKDPANNFHLVDTQGTLRPADWANELHPKPAGFKAMAEKFADALTSQFNGRI